MHDTIRNYLKNVNVTIDSEEGLTPGEIDQFSTYVSTKTGMDKTMVARAINHHEWFPDHVADHIKEVSGTSMPKTRAPEVSAPEVSAPEVSAPEVSAPEVSAPEVSAPEVSAPEVSAPEADASDVDQE